MYIQSIILSTYLLIHRSICLSILGTICVFFYVLSPFIHQFNNQVFHREPIGGTYWHQGLCGTKGMEAPALETSKNAELLPPIRPPLL